MRRFSLGSALAALVLCASASSAPAAVTLGQLAPTIPAPATCSALPVDRVQPSVTSGNSYVVPSTGGIGAWTVTSWTTNASANAGTAMTLKFFRPLGGATYMAVTHDGPRALTASTQNTFSGLSLQVKAGDMLGNNKAGSTALNACRFDAPGDSLLDLDPGNLADGESGTFGPEQDFRINISAMVTPTNSISFGKVKRNENKGTAKITIEGVPNPGELVLSGKGLRRRELAVGAPGDFRLKITAKGNKRENLNEDGKVKVKPKITFTPIGGDPSTQSRKLKLKKNL